MAKAYPGTLLEFERWFRTDETCRKYLIRLRWPKGFRCPRCGGVRAWMKTRGVLTCARCHADVRPAAGTIFQDSRLPLGSWFRAIWWITNQKGGVSALGLQRLLGLGSYETAWTCLHKLRRAMVLPDRDRLCGSVEVDETLVGGRQKGGKGGHRDKALVAIAVEIKEDRMGRVRIHHVKDNSKKSLHAFVRAAIAPGSRVVTDGWKGYRGVARAGYRHEPTILDGKGREASSIVLPRVHRVAALLKR